MSRKSVVLRAAANGDIEAIVDDYAAQAGSAIAERFVAELERALDRIGRHPASGSPHYALELSIPGLRCWKMRRFPHLLFYVERDAAVEIWRVLHGERDIPRWVLPTDLCRMRPESWRGRRAELGAASCSDRCLAKSRRRGLLT